MTQGAETPTHEQGIPVEEICLYATQAELAVICAILADPMRIWEVSKVIKPEWMFKRGHMYRLLLHIAQQSQGNVPDYSLPSLLAWVSGNIQFTALTPYKTWEVQVLSPSAAAPHRRIDKITLQENLRQIREAAQRVGMLRYGKQLTAMACNAHVDPGEMACDYRDKLAKLGGASGGDEPVPACVYVNDAMKMCRMRKAIPAMMPLAIPGFPVITAALGGGIGGGVGGLHVLGARSKEGKTTTLVQYGTDFATIGLNPVPVLMLDTEMTSNEQAERQLAYLSQVSCRSIHNGNMSQAVHEAADRLAQAPFTHRNVAGKPIEYSLSLIRNFARQVGYSNYDFEGHSVRIANQGIVLFDYIKYCGTLNKGMGEYQIIGAMASALKDVASETGLTIYAGVQLNRNSLGKDGNEWADSGEGFVAGSDRISHYCDSLALLQRIPAQWEAAMLDKWPGKPLRFTHVWRLQMARSAESNRRGIPLRLNGDLSHFAESTDPESMTFLQECMNNHKKSSGRASGGGTIKPLPRNQPCSK